MKRHIKVFHPETLAETVHETKTECEESDNIAMALSGQEEASSDVEEETPNNEKPSDDESSLAKKMNDFNDLLDEEGREEDEENEEPIAAGMDEGGDEGELVKSEEPSDIPDICPFWYATILFGLQKSTPKKCVNLRQKLPRDKTA